MTEKEFIPNIKQITLNKLLVGMLTKTLQMDKDSFPTKVYLNSEKSLGENHLFDSFSFKWNLFPLLVIGDFRMALKRCRLYVKDNYNLSSQRLVSQSLFQQFLDHSLCSRVHWRYWGNSRKGVKMSETPLMPSKSSSSL